MRERTRSVALIVSIVATGLLSFCGVMVETSINIAFPALMREFGVASSEVQWITTGYLLVLAILMPASGYLIRRFCMRHLFVAACALFSIGLVVDACAPSFAVLVVGRLLQGAGTACALPLMFDIVYTQVPERSVGTMAGIASFTTSIAPAVGPSLGGVLIQLFGWRSVFWSLLPIAVLACVLGAHALHIIDDPNRRRTTSFDMLGFLLLASCSTGILIGMSNLEQLGSQALFVAVPLAIAWLAGAACVIHSRTCDQPIIDWHIFKSRTFAFSSAALITGQAVCLGLNYLLPNAMQLVLGTSTAIAGMALVPGCLAMAATVLLSGQAFDRFGPRTPILAGALAAVAACLLLALAGGRAPLGILVAGHALFSAGQASTNVSARTLGLTSLPPHLISSRNAFTNTVQQLAGGVGTALCASAVSIAQASGASGAGADATALAQATAAGTEAAYLCMLACTVLLVLFSLRALARTEQTR